MEGSCAEIIIVICCIQRYTDSKRSLLKGSDIMDMDMSIAALSVGMHAQQTMQDMGTSVLKMAMNAETEGVQELLGGVAGSLDPNVGSNLDIQA